MPEDLMPHPISIHWCSLIADPDDAAGSALRKR